jgi:hypothetical protein
MLLAAARGYAGCAVVALSNWVLRRDDQVGCLLSARASTTQSAAATP